jgi:hypothetical protein
LEDQKMKILSFIVAGCVLLVSGWLFLSPDRNDSNLAVVDKLKHQIVSAFDRLNESIDSGEQSSIPLSNTPEVGESNRRQGSLIEPVAEGKAQSALAPNDELSEEIIISGNSDRDSLNSQEINGGPLSEMQTSVPYRKDSPSALNMADPIQPAVIDAATVTPTPSHSPQPAEEEVRQTNDRPLSDEEMERYLERIQEAGTRTSANLDRIARLLDR